jgi:CubicO group peptidase (beta-lactamase class C family)
VPGLAVAIVKDDSVIFLRGFGVRNVAARDSIGPHTVFATASVTKSFTATALAMLVQEGKLAWDDPVVRHLPGFRLADPHATTHATVRDLLSHRSGAPGLALGETRLYDQTASSEELLRRAAGVPGSPFRDHFDYSNVMYLAAGQLIPAVTGTSWADFVRARIFTPLGMTRSSPTLRATGGMPDVATPHARRADTVRAVPSYSFDNLGPAGSINASAYDLALWVRAQLAGGRLGAQRLVDSARLAETHQPLVVMPHTGTWLRFSPGVGLSVYGMGWIIADYRGERVVEQGGILPGMHALVGLMPSRRLGVVVLSNLDFGANQLPEALRYRVYDAVLGGPARDWSAELLAGTTGR